MARMAELQPVARRPFARILSTAAFRSSCVGASVSSHLKLCLYHSSVDGDTLERNWRSRINSENPIFVVSEASTKIRRKIPYLIEFKLVMLSMVERSLGVRGVGSSNLPVQTIFRPEFIRSAPQLSEALKQSIFAIQG